MAHELPEGASEHFHIWEGVPPGSEDWTWTETTGQVPWSPIPRRMTRNVVHPGLTMFRPENPNGTALIIAPGGAFHFLMIDHEGHDMARWVTQFGITAFVLAYRLAPSPPGDSEVSAFRAALHRELQGPDADGPFRQAMRVARAHGEADGRAAVRFVRARAADWGLDPARIGMAGFSAGGGVAFGAVAAEDHASRPDFVIGVYPAARPDMVAPDNPPDLFLIHADDDPQVDPGVAVNLYRAWHERGGSAELHIVANGGHGFGMTKDGSLADSWTDLCARWLRARGYARAG